MRNPIIIALLCAALSACLAIPQDLKPVWTQTGKPAAGAAAPYLFKVTPLEAFLIARESRGLSWKHHWHLYADSKYYYVHDIFLGDGPRRAFRQGLRIDGKTGEIQSRRESQ